MAWSSLFALCVALLINLHGLSVWAKAVNFKPNWQQNPEVQALQLPSSFKADLEAYLTEEYSLVIHPRHSSQITLQADESGRLDTNRPVTVLYHGLFMSPQYFARIQEALLKKRHHVFNIRLPGHYGKTYGGLDLVKRSDLLETAEKTFNLAQEINGKVHLIGHSVGGLLVTNLARNNPDQVSSLVLFAPALQVQGYVVNFIEWVTAFGLSWKDLEFGEEDPKKNYRSSFLAKEVIQLTEEIGLSFWNSNEYVAPIKDTPILMFTTGADTAVDPIANLFFVRAFKDSPTFQHIHFPLHQAVLHNKVGRFSRDHFQKEWNELVNFLRD